MFKTLTAIVTDTNTITVFLIVLGLLFSCKIAETLFNIIDETIKLFKKFRDL